MQRYYKEAGELIPGDIYFHRVRSRALARHVIAVRPGLAATTVEIVCHELETDRHVYEGFFRCNRVEIREPSKRITGALAGAQRP